MLEYFQPQPLSTLVELETVVEGGLTNPDAVADEPVSVGLPEILKNTPLKTSGFEYAPDAKLDVLVTTTVRVAEEKMNWAAAVSTSPFDASV